MKKYEVYRADSQDITYTRNFYQGDHLSISLLKSKEPAQRSLFESQTALVRVNDSDLQQIDESNNSAIGVKKGVDELKAEAGVVQLQSDLFRTESSSI